MNVKCRVICFKLFLCLLYPVTRIRKMIRNIKMKPLKSIAIMTLGSFFVLTYLIYLNWNKIMFGGTKPSSLSVTPSLSTKKINKYEYATPMKHVSLHLVYPDEQRHYPNESYEFEENKPVNMLETPGCIIPLSMVNYAKYLNEDKKPAGTCGKRAVFLTKIDGDRVKALIKPKVMKTYLRKSVFFDCCYRFLSRSTNKRNYGKKIRFTKCIKFQDSAVIKLETDFVNVQCFDYDKRNTSHAIYDDMFAFAKSINVSKTSDSNCTAKYNVLMLGMDSMSLTRFAETLRRTVNFFHDNSFLAYRGYHKVGDNTFPNLMAFLTGRNLSDISNKCANKMDRCHDLLIWNEFKEAGYVTAYGEDYLRLPDTFTKQYAFKTPPTDHYMRPFFMKGETEVNHQTLVCAGKKSSGQQLLNYALDFAKTYRNEQFFGLFWMNSFSHNPKNRPQDADVMIENFMNQLTYTGVLRNTFVIALSDHGIRFGERRKEVESYYDERLPHLFILAPDKFAERYPLKVKSLVFNQYRLATPYDIHQTLREINEISSCKNNSRPVSSVACPNCHSMFDIISDNRTCQDAAIHSKWCSCHKLYPLPVQDEEGVKSVQTVVSYVKQLGKAAKAKPSWRCASLSLKNIIRIHFYYDEDKITHYVVAFTVTPSNVSYEATVLLKDGKRALVGPVSIISPKNVGKCAVNHADRLFCYCQKIK